MRSLSQYIRSQFHFDIDTYTTHQWFAMALTLEGERDRLLELLERIVANDRVVLDPDDYELANELIASCSKENPTLSLLYKVYKESDNVTIPRKLATTLLGILESEYEGTEMFQDEINELKGLIESKCSHEWEVWSVAPASHKGELAKWRHCKKCDKFDFRREHRYE